MRWLACAGGRGRGRVRKAYVIGGSSSNDDEDMKDVQAPSLIGGQAQESGSDEDGTSPSSAKQRAPAGRWNCIICIAPIG